MRSAAASEHQHVFVRKMNADAIHCEIHPVCVRIVARESAAAVDDGVHRAADARALVQFVEEWDDVALVGYGDVDAAKVAHRKEFFKLTALQRAQLVIRRAECGVQTR